MGNIEKCPYCSSTMKKTKAPFKYHGSYIGKFDAYVCNECNRTYFTEKAYKEIMKLPLNPDEQNDFSDFVDMQPEIVISSPIIINKKESEPTSFNNLLRIGIITIRTDEQNRQKLNGEIKNEYSSAYA